MELSYILIVAFFILTILAIGLVYWKSKSSKNEVIADKTIPGEKESLLEIKQNRLKELREFIHLNSEGEFKYETRDIFVAEELKVNSIIGGSILAGAIKGGGESYYNLVSKFSENQEFFETMEERYNRKFLEADRGTWLKILRELNDTETTKMGYLSNFAGYQAEKIGIKTLESLGYEVEAYASRIHPHNDLKVTTVSGEEFDISVKTYGEVQSLKQAVIKHPNSKNYLINKELFSEISNNKEMKMWFETKGITLINGGFSNTELREKARTAIETFQNIGDSMSDEIYNGIIENIFEELPLGAFAVYFIKWKKDKKSFNDGKQSSYEFKVNNIGNGAGIAGRIGAALAFGKIGAILGTPFGPIGNGAGALVGGVVGGTGAGTIINKSKEHIKWGNIYSAQLKTSEYYHNELFGFREKEWLSNSILKIKETEKILEEYKINFKQYFDELDESSITLPSLEAIVLEQKIKDLESYLMFKEEMLEKLIDKIEDEFLEWYLKLHKQKINKQNTFVKNRLLGEWVLRQSLHNNFPLKRALNQDYLGYVKQFKTSPNYVNRFTFDPVEHLSLLNIDTQIEIIDSIRTSA